MRMTPWPSARGVEVGEGGSGCGARQWGFPPLRAFERSDPQILRSGMVNVGLRASYRHDGRGPLTTDLVKMLPIKTLIGDVKGLGLKLVLGI
jgi:hypothetical protein